MAGPISEIAIAFFDLYGWSPVAVGAGACTAGRRRGGGSFRLLSLISFGFYVFPRSYPQSNPRVGLGQQPAGQVALVPSRDYQHNRSSRPQPRQQIGLPPIPMMGPGCFASARGGRRGRAPDTMARTISRRRLVWLSLPAKRSTLPSAVSCRAWMRSLW